MNLSPLATERTYFEVKQKKPQSILTLAGKLNLKKIVIV